MKVSVLWSVLGSALLLATSQASHDHRHLHRHSRLARKQHTHEHDVPLEKRSTCSLPDHPDLVKVAGAQNNGFAMSPDQPCTSGKYCPYACPPGKVMAQWDPDSKYSYPESMNGGIFCDGGVARKPFPNKPYCVDGTGTVSAVNNCGKIISFCQTVLPGNEAMLIPTDVDHDVDLSVPGPSYWAGTAAHFYINPPGVSASEGCVWGDPSKPIGNWSPYVAGANTVDNGDTYVKIAWNPIWTASSLSKEEPSFGVKIECDGGGCNGLPCKIDPSNDGVGGLESPASDTGVGGAKFCVATVPKGGKARIVVFNTDGSGSGSGSSSSSYPTPTAAPSSSVAYSTASPTSPVSSPSSSAPYALASVLPGIFQENTTESSHGESQSSAATTATPANISQSPTASPTTSKNEGAADKGGSAIAGLVVALVAAATLY